MPSKDETEEEEEEPAEEVSGDFFKEQLGVYPCTEEGPKPFEVDCKHFYNCAKSGAGLKGELLKCPEGSQYDEGSKKCKKGADASSCQKPLLNPLLFPPSPAIADAKEAGAEFVQ